MIIACIDPYRIEFPRPQSEFFHSSQSSMTALSTAWSEALTATLIHKTKEQFESLLLRFTEEVAAEYKLEREGLTAIWNRVAPDCAVNIKAAINRETAAKEAEVRR